jgi:hypothetical protein
MPAWAIIAIVGGALLVLGVIILVVVLRKPAQAPGQQRLCGGCRRIMMPDWQQCLFCGWKPEPPKAIVEFLCGPMAGQTILLDAPVTTIGSIGGNSIVLADPAVSRKHAGIRKAGEGYELADLGSTNGVYVNGQRTAKRILTPGDVIRVGTSEMIFRISAK